MEIDAQLCGSVSDPVRVYFHLQPVATHPTATGADRREKRPEAVPLCLPRTRSVDHATGAAKRSAAGAGPARQR
jgi:hypothetical protein